MESQRLENRIEAIWHKFMVGVSDLLATKAIIGISQGLTYNNILQDISLPTASTPGILIPLSIDVGTYRSHLWIPYLQTSVSSPYWSLTLISIFKCLSSKNSRSVTPTHSAFLYMPVKLSLQATVARRTLSNLPLLPCYSSCNAQYEA